LPAKEPPCGTHVGVYRAAGSSSSGMRLRRRQHHRPTAMSRQHAFHRETPNRSTRRPGVGQSPSADHDDHRIELQAVVPRRFVPDTCWSAAAVQRKRCAQDAAPSSSARPPPTYGVRKKHSDVADGVDGSQPARARPRAGSAPGCVSCRPTIWCSMSICGIESSLGKNKRFFRESTIPMNDHVKH